MYWRSIGPQQNGESCHWLGQPMQCQHQSAPLVISVYTAAAVTAARQGFSDLNLMAGRHAAVMQFY
jgi:hypothetical protein